MGLSYIKNVEDVSVFLQISGGLAKLFEIKKVQAEIEEIKSILDEIQGEGKEDEEWNKVFLRTLKDKNDNYIFPPNSNGEISAWVYKILESSVMPEATESQVNKPFIWLGNLRYILIGDRLQMSVSFRSIHPIRRIPNSNLFCAKGSSCDRTAESILQVADSFDIKVLAPCSSAGLPIHPCLPGKDRLLRGPSPAGARRDRRGIHLTSLIGGASY